KVHVLDLDFSPLDEGSASPGRSFPPAGACDLYNEGGGDLPVSVLDQVPDLKGAPDLVPATAVENFLEFNPSGVLQQLGHLVQAMRRYDPPEDVVLRAARNLANEVVLPDAVDDSVQEE